MRPNLFRYVIDILYFISLVLSFVVDELYSVALTPNLLHHVRFLSDRESLDKELSIECNLQHQYSL